MSKIGALEPKRRFYDIRTDLFVQAKAVLDRVRTEYYDGMHLVQEMYGERLSGEEEATEIIKDYMREHDLLGKMGLYWSESMSGRCVSRVAASACCVSSCVYCVLCR